MVKFPKLGGGGGSSEGRSGSGIKLHWSIKPPKLVALLGLLLVLCGMGFAYLGFDVGLQQHSNMNDALIVASGTQQMVCATICISTGILVWAISVNGPVPEQYG
tara:strand:- start:163 stop:474 length:312 start_codon:yes stop_codon:yes gene_type:complete